MSPSPSRGRSASLGAGQTLLLQTTATALLLVPFALGWTVVVIAVLCNIGGWVAVWSVLYFMASRK